MKICKVILMAAGILLMTAGIVVIVLWVSDTTIRVILLAIFLLSGLLNIGYYCYFRKRFIDFTNAVCHSTEQSIRGEKNRSQYNKETLPSKMIMELDKVNDIFDARLSESNQEKQKLQQTISEISHQLKTPLSNIRMYHDMLAEPDIKQDEKEKFMEIIQKQLEKLEFLIDSLIKSSRLESEMIKLTIEDNTIFRTLESAINEIVKKAEQKKIEIIIDCRPTIRVPHDRKWTVEAISNVLDNAVKYTPEKGKILIMVTYGEMYAEIRIQDNGMGIDPKHYNDIFKRFYREQSASKIEGVGLGLYIARNIISLQGGYILVRSELGKGACFSIFLPNRKVA